jgi:hypothetical protein
MKGALVSNDLELRVRRLEDRALISEVVIQYALGVDRRDWEMFARCFTDPLYADFSGLGGQAGEGAREDFVAGVRQALDGFTATQHISPNHVIEFDDADSDRAICRSYMYAQHLLDGSEGGDVYLARGAYTSHMRRTSDGWRIERLIQHLSWQEGNQNAVSEATARNLAANIEPDAS